MSAKPPAQDWSDMKAKLPGNGTIMATKTTDKDNEHNDDATYADVSQLHHDGADTSLQCIQQRGCDVGDKSSATRAKMSTRHGQ
jgi:hypothetical protein